MLLSTSFQYRFREIVICDKFTIKFITAVKKGRPLQ